jgi:tryptophan synthase alpha chain
VTGARESISGMMDAAVARIRKYSSLPVGIGFGISRPEHVRSIARYADAIIVGSAIIKEVETRRGQPDMLEQVGKFVRSLKQATRI